MSAIRHDVRMVRAQPAPEAPPELSHELLAGESPEDGSPVAVPGQGASTQANTGGVTHTLSPTWPPTRPRPRGTRVDHALSAWSHAAQRGKAAGVNQVHLIGVIASRPPPNPAAGSGFVLLTERAAAPGVERHRILIGRRRPAEALAVGDTAYVRGHLERRGTRAVVVLAEAFQLLADTVPASAAHTLIGGTHRSPVAHDRRGHLRRLGAGTARERLIWVRPTTVRGAAPSSGEAPGVPPAPPHRQAAAPLGLLPSSQPDGSASLRA